MQLHWTWEQEVVMSSSTPVATTEVMFQPVQVGRYELAHRREHIEQLADLLTDGLPACPQLALKVG